MGLQEDLSTLTDHVNAAKDLVDKLAADASIEPDPTSAEQLEETVVSALKGYGYEITPPPTKMPVTDGTEGSAPLAPEA